MKDAKPKTKTSAKHAADGLRHQVHSSMHYALMFLLDKRNQLRVRRLVETQRPYKHFHSHHVKHMNSFDANEKFMAEMASGEAWLPFHCKAWDVLQDPALLAKCGVIQDLEAARLKSLTQLHPTVVEQDEIVEELWSLTLSLCMHSTRSKIVNCWSYPGKFALVGHLREDLKARAMDTLRIDASVWDHNLRYGNTNFWRARQRRSFMRQPTVLDLFDLANRAKFVAKPALLALNRALHGGLNWSRTVEELNRIQRGREDRSRNAKEMSRVNVWRNPIKAKLLDGQFDYPEIKIDGIHLSKDESKMKTIPEPFFTRPQKECSLPIDGIVGKKGSKPKWPTFTPQGVYALAAEFELMRDAMLKNDLTVAAGCFWSGIVFAGYVFRRKCDVATDDTWYLSLGHVGWACVLAWPLAMDTTALRKAFFPRQVALVA